MSRRQEKRVAAAAKHLAIIERGVKDLRSTILPEDDMEPMSDAIDNAVDIMGTAEFRREALEWFSLLCSPVQEIVRRTIAETDSEASSEAIHLAVEAAVAHESASLSFMAAHSSLLIHSHGKRPDLVAEWVDQIEFGYDCWAIEKPPTERAQKLAKLAYRRLVASFRNAMGD